MRSSHFVLLAVALLFAIGSLASANWHITLPWVESLCSNLSAGFIGSFLTVLLIDRRIANEREAELRRVRALALGQLRAGILQNLDLLCEWYKAAAQQKPTTNPKLLRDIFSDEYYRELPYLDFSKAAPTSPPITWFRWSAGVAHEVCLGLNAVVDKYAAFIDADTLELVEALANSPVLGLLRSCANWPTSKSPKAEARTYNIIAGSGVLDHLRLDVDRLLGLVEVFNKCVARPITISDLSLWREDVGGRFGSSRMRDAEMMASNPMIAMGRGLPPVGGPQALKGA